MAAHRLSRIAASILLSNHVDQVVIRTTDTITDHIVADIHRSSLVVQAVIRTTAVVVRRRLRSRVRDLDTVMDLVLDMDKEISNTIIIIRLLQLITAKDMAVDQVDATMTMAVAAIIIVTDMEKAAAVF
ncbi:hypothetical protein H4R99_005790 [Coemansia sp. RSA 1722]|nr:hypothetical protein LPJ57_002365 [Coemansia sp. RSA 486]KAJ2228743.1 hypothetical protein IWW45_006478 [Coemansia sp. RSA 485]KAJ2594399.1 hypothetical protein H4R99_005790 [Coemansia sp. RSA 1722]KAJ2635649.1 hypothetical protein GGF40_003479 [Coemansia sp. RSA 1286]